MTTNAKTFTAGSGVDSIVEIDDRIYINTSGGGAGVSDHGALTGLTDNDHPQYILNSDFIGSGFQTAEELTASGVRSDTVNLDAPAQFASLTSIALAADDRFLVEDFSDSENKKYITGQNIIDLVGATPSPFIVDSDGRILTSGTIELNDATGNESGVLIEVDINKATGGNASMLGIRYTDTASPGSVYPFVIERNLLPIVTFTQAANTMCQLDFFKTNGSSIAGGLIPVNAGGLYMHMAGVAKAGLNGTQSKFLLASDYPLGWYSSTNLGGGGSVNTVIDQGTNAGYVRLSSGTTGFGLLQFGGEDVTHNAIKTVSGLGIEARLADDSGPTNYLAGGVFLEEKAAADADVAGKGQIWVKNDTPNTLWFTDDTGTDTQLGTGGGSGVNRITWSLDGVVPSGGMSGVDGGRYIDVEHHITDIALWSNTPSGNVVVTISSGAPGSQPIGMYTGEAKPTATGSWAVDTGNMPNTRIIPANMVLYCDIESAPNIYASGMTLELIMARS